MRVPAYGPVRTVLPLYAVLIVLSCCGLGVAAQAQTTARPKTARREARPLPT